MRKSLWQLARDEGIKYLARADNAEEDWCERIQNFTEGPFVFVRSKETKEIYLVIAIYAPGPPAECVLLVAPMEGDVYWALEKAFKLEGVVK